MNSKVLAFAFSFCMVTLPTHAANWVLVSKNDSGDIFFIDKSSLQRDGDSVTFWRRTNYKERSEHGDLSTKLQRTVNCRTREMIDRYMFTYDDIDNRGRLTSSFDTTSLSKWKPIAPETMNWEMMLFVCRK